MPYAPDYVPSNSFADDEANQAAGRSTVRTVEVDNQLADISVAHNALNARNKKLQRDDDKLRDFIVEPYTLSEQTRAMLVAAGKVIRGAWAVFTNYAVGDLVQYQNVAYLCKTEHNSGPTFNLGFWIGISGDGEAQAYAEQAMVSSASAAASAVAASSGASSAIAAAAAAVVSQAAAASSAVAAQNAADSIAGLSPVNLSAYMISFLSSASAAQARTSLSVLSIADLSDTLTTTKGAGAIGFGPTTAYSVGTIGAALLAGPVQMLWYLSLAQRTDVKARTLLVDCTAILQQVIDAVGALGGGIIDLGVGWYRHDATLVMRNGVKLIGQTWVCSRLHYTGTGDQIVVRNPINASTVAQIHVEGVYLRAPNAAAQRACFFDTGSSLLSFMRVFFESAADGLILDQSELVTISQCYMAGAICGAWLVNGADRNPGGSFTGSITGTTLTITGVTSGFISLGATITGAGVAGNTKVTAIVTGTGGVGTYTVSVSQTVGSVAITASGSSADFTNRVLFESSQFNGGGGYIGVIDDGGVAHEYRSNNFNAGTTYIRAAAVNSFIVDGGEYEAATGPGIYFRSTKRNGASAFPCETVRISGCFAWHAGANSFVELAVAGMGAVEVSNNFFNTAGNPFAGANNCAELIARGNRQVGTGAGYGSINNHFSGLSVAPTMVSGGGNFVLGNGVLTRSVSRVGRRVEETILYERGSTTVNGTGNYSWPLAFAEAGVGDVFPAAVSCAGNLYAGVGQVGAPPSAHGSIVTSQSASNAVGGTVPGVWVAGNYIKFTSRYLAANNVG